MSLKKSQGIIYGLAIGDALGWPTEFLSFDKIKSKYGSKGIQDLQNPANFTDDTQMSIAVAESLIESGKKGIEPIMASVKEEFIKWYHSPENNRSPGNTCLGGVERLEQGIHWSKSGITDSKGCGSAMRAAPIGYFYQNNPKKLKEVAHAIGICTHGYPTADAACIGAAYLIKLALDGIEPKNMIAEMLSFTKNISDEWEDTISKIEKCLSWEDEEKALSYLGEGWTGEEAVALALYCFLKHPKEYKKVVIRGANTNGDSDSIACIGGAISGAYLGIEAIPKTWIEKIEKTEYLGSLAERLSANKS